MRIEHPMGEWTRREWGFVCKTKARRRARLAGEEAFADASICSSQGPRCFFFDCSIVSALRLGKRRGGGALRQQGSRDMHLRLLCVSTCLEPSPYEVKFGYAVGE